ncbi:hypothetical protein MNEG_9518 [Monoraphidium neglectum]|uniref:Uncharacterized protein n=1 Tax=Monoraphidium neglectum TaxID=145388 RepID=A0A0D2KSA6_9CHLO|nr:hypothetical protein MNEG_9518 [Monoraphidium neglectum]KIY98448.1 hypothetical protein MNEG_9518 [Monoraphidium neglectum]|eukprot:XP_013897468.1 hypothetical protein MNEG_9518 [Monoraphidium neglectum]
MGLTDERSSNPLKQVLDLLGEKVECARYSQWVLHPPGAAPFPVVADRDEYAAAIHKAAGPQGPFSALVDRHVTDPWLSRSYLSS